MRLRDTGGYEKKAPKQRRELLDNAILSLVPDLKFRSSILPSFARAFVQKKGNLERVHILAYCPKGHGHACAIEDRISLVDTEISLRTDGRKVRNVYLAPGWKELPFAWKDGYSKFSSFHILKKVRLDASIIAQLIIHVTPLGWRKMNFQLTFFK